MGKLAYKIGKIIQQVSEEMQLYEDARQKLLHEYCIKDENDELKIDENGNVTVKKENISLYNEKMKEMNETIIHLNILPLEFDEIENLEFTPKEIMSIDWLIKKNKEE